jgi:hypothetical protein
MDFANLQFKCPFTCTVSGPTSSGKTVVTRRILKNFKLLFNQPIDTLKVVWCYGVVQQFDPIENVECTYIEGLISEDSLLQLKPHVLIIDDLMNQLAGDKRLTDIFTRGSHHFNISVIFISQNLFPKGPEMRNVSLNSQYYIIMKNPRDRTQIYYFARQVFHFKYKRMIEAYEDATREPHGYLKVDLTQTTPDEYRLQTRINPEENSKVFAPIIYLPSDFVRLTL